ncbi:TraB/GumN family protein [Aurantimonas sp. Leaf443]|uniref:TraB/GumN family protein n=1 Tax=Aurantimonas sp. Leaf443 TaxID=1736378 RepID=UPI0006FA47BA|nr:TraB/GumN family protein [Aurantimonas sp. Leaf443]KQT85500.1 hypothetical protein ASG48_09800 [Aurantimonas sp. Leaf443]
MTRTIDRLAALALAAALALPLLLLALLGAATLAPARAQDASSCEGRSLIEGLKADGRYAAVAAEAARVPNGRGKFFRIERAGLAPSHLFGTIHLTDPRVLALPPGAEAAFAEASRLVIETTDIMDQKKAAAAFFADPALTALPAGRRLGDLVSADQRALLEEALARKGIPFQSIETLQPWFVSVAVSVPPCEAARKAEGLGVLDLTLAERASAAGKPVEGLESAAEQLQALASLPLDLQVESLVAGVENADRMPDLMETMVELWRAGEIGTIMPALEKALPAGAAMLGTAEGASAFEKAILTDRNARMAERMQAALSAGGAFVAVGALHLPGPDGLVEMLRARGWTVSRAD